MTRPGRAVETEVAAVLAGETRQNTAAIADATTSTDTAPASGVGWDTP